MANQEDESRKRRREREDEQEREDAKKNNEVRIEEGTEKLDELIQRVDPLISQLNNLYNMFMSGAENVIPMERRKQLDQLMVSLQMMSKPTAGSLFKYAAILSKYTTHKERWDKMLKDLEDGKIKRNRPGSRGPTR